MCIKRPTWKEKSVLGADLFIFKIKSVLAKLYKVDKKSVLAELQEVKRPVLVNKEECTR